MNIHANYFPFHFSQLSLDPNSQRLEERKNLNYKMVCTLVFTPSLFALLVYKLNCGPPWLIDSGHGDSQMAALVGLPRR